MKSSVLLSLSPGEKKKLNTNTTQKHEPSTIQKHKQQQITIMPKHKTRPHPKGRIKNDNSIRRFHL
jgi:hypothetical protein